jgi:prolyl oligopeptidase
MVQEPGSFKRRSRAAAFLAIACLVGSCTSPKPMNDPANWLAEIEGKQALDWVRRQNTRTANALESSRYFPRNYEHAQAVHVQQDALPLTRGAMIHDGWLFDVLTNVEHPRGLWRRTRYDAFLRGAPDWEPLIDVAQVAQQRGRALNLLSPTHCFGDRCLVRMEGAGTGSMTFDIREFDLRTRQFVDGGFARPPYLNMAMWVDADTLLLADNFGPGTLSLRNHPISLREWPRGAAPVKEVLRGDPDGIWGLMPYTRPSTSGSSLLTVWSVERDRTRSYLVEPDGRVLTTPLPDRSFMLGEYQGEVIAQIATDQPWTSGDQSIKPGSLISIRREQIGDAAPSVRTVFAPHERESLAGMGVGITSGGVLVATYDNIRARLSVFTLEGGRWVRHQIRMPDYGSVIVKATDPTSHVAIVSFESFLQPPTLYAVDVRSRTAWPLKSAAEEFDASGLRVEQHEAPSADGTLVPYFLVRPKSLSLDGRAPTVLYGYGALGAPRTPHYDAGLGRLWLESGGVFVLANIRGGGEFGPTWHVRRRERQRAYEDFIAVAEDLIRRKVTSPRRLGIRGHSNGGLLVGVSLNTRPELFNAAVIEHPVLDLRVHTRGLDSPEYGAWSDPEERAFLESTSPLQNLKKRPHFPAPFLKTATNDSVLPTPARQYAAKLDSFGLPYYFYESADGRHNMWATPTDAAYYEALLYTYLAERLM